MREAEPHVRSVVGQVRAPECQDEPDPDGMPVMLVNETTGEIRVNLFGTTADPLSP
jgi:hypothetical protein